ncbi:hypothetical protein OESDEN_19702 [Oesophagostomum dentatum]|uniref:Uncharacterized protein n=1 Tax=Oesophagostomum dentatum TaxID=61180 RepID=A0A0B1S9Q0_OESDE|nr:hypothetical protein OESDEN_19702 [Oesophagostomum dentatum]
MMEHLLGGEMEPKLMLKLHEDLLELSAMEDSDTIRWLNRRIDKGLVLFGLVALICYLHAYRIATHDEFFVFTIRKCLFRKTGWLDSVNDEEFFNFVSHFSVAVCAKSHDFGCDCVFTFNSSFWA